MTRFRDFGKELRWSFKVAADYYDCAELYDGCPAWQASKEFACRDHNPTRRDAHHVRSSVSTIPAADPQAGDLHDGSDRVAAGAAPVTGARDLPRHTQEELFSRLPHLLCKLHDLVARLGRRFRELLTIV